jgi:Tol biopolymer transport system component
MDVMRWLAGLLLLLAACRFNFDELGEGGAGGDAGSGIGDGAPPWTDAAELGDFGMPTQHAAIGVVGRSDQGPSLTADMLELYFYSSRNCMNCYDIFVATRSSVTAPWNTPIEVAELTNAAADMAPEISPDGLTLWFASERQGGAGTSDIWMTTRMTRTSAWAIPTRVPNLSTNGYDLDPALGDDGLTMTITSDGAGGIAADILIATRATLTSPWSTPVPIGELNTSLHDSAASLRDVGHQLFFAREVAANQFDVYVATRESATAPFTGATAVANINGPQIDFDAWLSPDLHTIFFASDRSGDFEIYSATR